MIAVVYIIFVFKEPLIGFIGAILYAFLFKILDREVGHFPYGIGNEVLQILTLLSIWYNAKRYNFSVLNNSLIWLTLVWFLISVIEIANPAGSNPRAWLQEIRTSALYPLLLAVMATLLINSKKRLNLFLVIIIIGSFIASLNGIKQVKLGMSAGEQAFVAGSSFHLIWGQLRVFSFYSDAGQFGASQAQFAVLGVVLCIGLRYLSFMKRAMLFIFFSISLYGMILSGTRGAVFALLGGVFCALLLSKNFKAVTFGGVVTLLLVAMLKFTSIGSGSYDINRLRSSFNPEDPSLNVRFMNQQKLSEYLASRPFGGGLGSIGYWADEYNPGKALTAIPPDSYWVKVWAMYGIVGMIIFFCIWMYLIGKCCGMVFTVKDYNLRIKLIALISGVFGLFLCSYGNEVMNTMPSLLVIQVSFGAIYSMCYNREKTDMLN